MTLADLYDDLNLTPGHVLTVSPTSGGRLLYNKPARFMGCALQNTSATITAVFAWFDGTDASGQPMFQANVGGNGQFVVWAKHPGWRFRNGMFLNVTTQAVQGAVFYQPLTPEAADADLQNLQAPADLLMVGPTSAGRVLASYPGVFYGYGFQNTSGVTLTFSLIDGGDANGRVIVPPFPSAASNAPISWWGHPGLHFRNGLYLNVTGGGTLQGAIGYRPYRRQARP